MTQTKALESIGLRISHFILAYASRERHLAAVRAQRLRSRGKMPLPHKS